MGPNSHKKAGGLKNQGKDNTRGSMKTGKTSGVGAKIPKKGK